MAVQNFNCVGAVVPRYGDDAPPGVGPDRVRAGAIAVQRLQPVAWRDAQIVQPLGGVRRRDSVDRKTGLPWQYGHWEGRAYQP
jgi:hypothetical protein